MICVDDLRHYESLPSAGKLLTLVFAMAGKDGATELRFGYHPDPPQVRMWYVIAGVPYELVPPPGEIWPELFRLLWSETRFHPSDRLPWWQRLWRAPALPETPAGGTLRVRFGNLPVDFDALFFRGPVRQYIELTRTGRLDVSDVSTEFLAQCMAKHAGPDGMMEL
jgi:hypothetical protein